MDCVDLVCVTSAGDDGSQDKGCGCALVGRGGPPWPALALLTVLLALLLRRR
jgi:MYXO-CTERM domain-containing protein